MRKIIESTLVSADGVIGDPPSWAMEYRDQEVQDDALARLASSDAMLMGRTLGQADWNNSTIVRGDVARPPGRGWNPRPSGQRRMSKKIL